jgi:DNA topoisomerase-1
MDLSAEEALKRAKLNRADRNDAGMSRKAKKLDSSDDSLVWEYFLPNGKKLKNNERIDFCNALAIPPAWSDVWICADDRGHIQATGVDQKGRLQYRYHPDWIAIKAVMKFDGIAGFAEVLPSLRARIKKDLKIKEMTLDKVSALVVRLMDLYNIRVGSDEYAKSNESYGLTTLKEGHFEYVRGKKAEGKHDAIFAFTGKSGKEWNILIEDDELVQMILETKKLGEEKEDQDLFYYRNIETENENDLKAEHINSYIQKATGESYTAKDFRTWAATWKCGSRLAKVDSGVSGKDLESWLLELPKSEGLEKLVSNEKIIPINSDKERNKAMLAVIDTVAADLGNTRAVCRSSYIHPLFMESFLDGSITSLWNDASKNAEIKGMEKDESTALHVLRL